MSISPDFPLDPTAIIEPNLRWYPGSDTDSTEIAKLIPPLVQKIRHEVHDWRLAGYPGVSKTSKSLLRFWFEQPHFVTTSDGQREFSYYFAQREAVETVIWLYENQQSHTAIDMLKYSSNSELSLSMFEENWTRYVLKLATGVGKTKVLSLVVAWSYFHKTYEPNSELSKNFLMIAPNIIVLDRLRDDFDALRIFYDDPVIPENGYDGRNWVQDFNPRLHIQDEVGPVSSNGNIFLTNIHRVYNNSDSEASLEDDDLRDFFLGSKPKGKTTDKQVDLTSVLANVDDLVVLNDEAHHIHDQGLAWFKAIEDLDSALRRKTTGKGISIQIDVTATPKKANGAIFPQTVCSFPLVEAIRQGIVKSPVLPDLVSRAALTEHDSSNVAERYSDHIKLGVLEWSQYRERFKASGKKPILFIMTTTTEEADQVAEYLEKTFPTFNGKTLVIHTKANGEVAEKTLKPAELAFLRKASRNIDSESSPYLAVISVLMLREGWDVQNVVTMVGLRPYNADSKILPEQTLGRGLRRMFRGDNNIREHVSVIGTEAFLNFVEQIQVEGVDLDFQPMGPGGGGRGPLVIEVDKGNKDKSLAKLEIELPLLSRRISRDALNLAELDTSKLQFNVVKLKSFSIQESREISFTNIDTGEVVWKTDLESPIIPTSQAVLTFLVNSLTSQLRLVGGKDVLYEKFKEFIRSNLFGQIVDLDSAEILRNIAEPLARKTLFDTFTVAINALTIRDKGTTRVVSSIKLSETKPTVVKNQAYVLSNKTLFNRVIGDSSLELDFAKFVDQKQDVVAFAKNILGINFKIEYVNAKGDISNYYPDFFVKTSDGKVYICETKGQEDVDVKRKWNRLVTWCEDASEIDPNSRTFTPLFIRQEVFSEYASKSKSFADFVDLVSTEVPLE